MTFINWEAECNRIMEEKYGVGIDDLPDLPWRNWYKTMDCVEAVEQAIDIVNKGEI
jgi:hypothetical protein